MKKEDPLSSYSSRNHDDDDVLNTKRRGHDGSKSKEESTKNVARKNSMRRIFDQKKVKKSRLRLP